MEMEMEMKMMEMVMEWRRKSVGIPLDSGTTPYLPAS